MHSRACQLHRLARAACRLYTLERWAVRTAVIAGPGRRSVVYAPTSVCDSAHAGAPAATRDDVCGNGTAVAGAENAGSVLAPPAASAAVDRLYLPDGGIVHAWQPVFSGEMAFEGALMCALRSATQALTRTHERSGRRAGTEKETDLPPAAAGLSDRLLYVIFWRGFDPREVDAAMLTLSTRLHFPALCVHTETFIHTGRHARLHAPASVSVVGVLLPAGARAEPFVSRLGALPRLDDYAGCISEQRTHILMCMDSIIRAQTYSVARTKSASEEMLQRIKGLLPNAFVALASAVHLEHQEPPAISSALVQAPGLHALSSEFVQAHAYSPRQAHADGRGAGTGHAGGSTHAATADDETRTGRRSAEHTVFGFALHGISHDSPLLRQIFTRVLSDVEFSRESGLLLSGTACRALGLAQGSAMGTSTPDAASETGRNARPLQPIVSLRAGARVPSVAPVFFLSEPIMPGQRMGLEIFEPRYRLLLRQHLETGTPFVVMQPTATTEVASYYDLYEQVFRMNGQHPSPSKETGAPANPWLDYRRLCGIDLAERTAPQVGTSAVVQAVRQQTSGARANVEVVGMQRVLVNEMFVAPGTFGLIHGATEPFADSADVAADTLAAEVRDIWRGSTDAHALFRQVFAGWSPTMQEPPGTATMTPEQLSWWLARVLPVSNSVRQSYLECGSTADRLQKQLSFLRIKIEEYTTLRDAAAAAQLTPAGRRRAGPDDTGAAAYMIVMLPPEDGPPGGDD